MTEISILPTSDVLTLLPARLRAARRELGLSLDAVAKLSGVSRSMVSQIERGESSPTIATLWNLTRALQLDFAGLLEGVEAPAQIDLLRNADVPTITNQGQGCVIRILSPPEDAGHHEVYDIRFDAGGTLDSAPHKRGASEHLTVIAGQIRLRAGAQDDVLHPGDTARYRADQPHCIAAEGGAAQVFLVVQDA